jgi:hypothetical protein
MFLRCKVRRKDGKQHRYWSVVENTRVTGGRVVQRHVLYLGEINDTQELAWRRSIAVLEDGAAQPRTLSLFLEDRCEGLPSGAALAIAPLQDVLNLGAEARMNTPGRAEDNWRWRCPEDILSAPEIEWLQDLTMTSNRSGVLRCLRPANRRSPDWTQRGERSRDLNGSLAIASVA